MVRSTSFLSPVEPLHPGPEDWPSRGACLTADPELFYHPYAEREPSRGNRERAAQQVCAGCPVRLVCRDYARAMQEPFGVWGGETETERAGWLGARAGQPA